MELYVKFISTLAFGLVGLGAVLKVLLETLFNEWDAFHEIAQRIAIAWTGKGGLVEHVRAEDILLEAEKRNAGFIGTRLVDARRRQINEIGAVEARVSQSMRRSSSVITASDIMPS
ncbi:MAG TPA: hypothetical protein DEB40_01805 [Elusimicrobia bacterium]|nr:hypothetical protein [Elusimicrobiota bacterium]HBT60465.1 hypothetical protein [Elusimicrobiota bacterium]